MTDPSRYREEHLYSGSGPTQVPRSRDIQQDNLSDCYFVGPLGGLADRQPQHIKDAISYDPAAGTFAVSMYRDNAGTPERVRIEVTQAEIADNIARGGGSRLDNDGGRTPMWPAVFETAYAKMHDANPADGLAEGYNAIGNFGSSTQAFFALTGQPTDDVRLAPTSTPAERERVFEQVRDALAAGRPVVLDTRTETMPGQDGLLDRHTYVVNAIDKDRRGEITLELRNPLGHNIDGEGPDRASAVTSVRLDALVDSGGLARLNIGAAPVLPTPGGVAPPAAVDTAPAAPAPIAPAPTGPALPIPAPATPGAPAPTGDIHLDRLMRDMRDGVSMTDALRGLATSPDGDRFREEGRAQYRQQAQDSQAQAPERMQPGPVQAEPEAPALRGRTM